MFSQKKMMPLDKIVLDKNNVRRHDDKNIKAIMKSLERSYQRKPIVMFGNTVIAGNGTVEAARRLGWKEIWVNDDPFESEEAAKAYALADNRTNDLSDFDEDKLKQQLEELEANGWDINELGFDDDILKDKQEVTDDIDELTTEYLIVVECSNEQEQSELFEEFKERNLICKIMT